jgi:hypothetical protein
MRSALVPAFAALALAGCQPKADALAGPPLPQEEQAVSALASLAGEYRVAGIDGTEVGGGIGLALSVTDTLIWFDPRCAGFSWTYTYSGGRLTTDRPQKPRSPGAPLVAGPGAATCRIAVHPEQQRLATALDAVTSARRTPSNGIELTGGGHSVTLYSQ